MHDKMKSGWVLSSVLALCFFKPCAASAADVILIVPVSASASTFYAAGYAPQYMGDGSGLTGAGRLATHTNANAGNLFWHSNGATVSNQWAEFDLGALYHVTNALVWQMAQSNLTTRGVKVYAIKVAGADHIFTTYSPSNLLNRATGGLNEPVQVVPLVARNIRFVRFEIQSNFGGDAYVGLSEVRFEGAIPEQNPTDVTLTPIGATASSNYGPQPYQYGPQWMIDGSGLTGAGRGATHTNANAVNLFWHSNTGVVVSAQWVEFDLGAPYRVTNALIWQLAQLNNAGRGVKVFTIKVAGSDHVLSTYSTNNMLSKASGEPNEPVRVVPLVASGIRYVRFEIQSNWGGDIVGLSEVRFECPSPETNAFLRIPVTNAVSSFYSLCPKKYLIDGSGLTGTGLAATHTNGLGQTSMWLSTEGLVTNEWAEFDFGWEIDLVSAAVWQYNQTQQQDLSLGLILLNRGVKRMTIYTAGNSKSYTEYGSVQLAKALGTAAEPAQLVRLNATGVRYVKFAINSNWGDSNMVGLSEVRFLYIKHAGTLIQML